MRPPLPLFACFAVGLAGVIGAGACERYEPPPTPVLEGLAGTELSDPKAPLVVDFGKPIDPATLRVKIAYDDTNVEGDLPDEDDDPSTDLRLILTHDDDDGDHGGHVDLDPSGATVRIVPDGALPVGPKLVLLIEPGLTAADGRVRTFRTRIPFSFRVQCGAGTRADKLTSGVYFLLLDVQEPIGSQIQLFGSLDVDPATGLLVGQFTNADRNPDGNRCPTPCGSEDACRLLPKAECVAPSTRAGTVDEHTDFVPNPTPPTGYSFFVEGCAADDPSGTALVTAPATMVVESPPVTVAGLTMTAYFAPDDKGVMRATGSLVADAVSLGGNTIGPGKGTMTALRVADAEVPPGIPQPPKPVADGGTDGGR